MLVVSVIFLPVVGRLALRMRSWPGFKIAWVADHKTGLDWTAGLDPGAEVGSALKPIKLPNPLLQIISEALKRRGKLFIGSLRNQLATTFDFALNPDQEIE
jgi:hypothetical protein